MNNQLQKVKGGEKGVFDALRRDGDPSKKPIALAQAYFNIQTFKQELNEQMMKDQARLDRRQEFSESDKRLSENIYYGRMVKGVQFAERKLKI